MANARSKWDQSLIADMENEPCGSTGRVIQEDDDSYGNKSLRNISVQTGEEFSPAFLRDRVTSRRITTAKLGFDVVHSPTSKPGFDVVESPTSKAGFDVVHNNPQITTLRSIRRRDSESCVEYSDFAPGYGFDRDSPSNRSIYSFGSPNSYQSSGKGSGAIGGTFSGKIKFLCSFGGRILPRPNDGKLRYVGGDTRIVSIRNNITYLELVKNTLSICNYHHTIKYQLPGEDLDALISVSSDEDLHHMIEEYHDLEKTSQRLRLFLVSSIDLEGPSSSEYVVAVNGMLETSNQRSFSRESVENQRETPTPFRLLENQNAQILNSPQIQFPKTSYVKGYDDTKPPFGFPNNCPVNENLCCFDSSGYYQNNPVDTLPIVGSPKQNNHVLQLHTTPQVGPHFRKPSNEFQPSTELMKNKETCFDTDNRNYTVEKEYGSNANFLEHKRNLPQIICRPDSQFSLHAPPSESHVNAIQDCSSSCAEKGTCLVQEMPGNYQISLNEPDFLIKSQRENSDLKQFFDNDVLLPVSTKGNNHSQFISPVLLQDKSRVSVLCTSCTVQLYTSNIFQ